MPFWKIYHSLNTLTQQDKTTLSASITEYYTSIGLPAFYVNIFFLPLASTDFFVGGKPISQKISIEILHIARQWQSTDHTRATRFKNSINEILRPYTLDKGVQVEFCVVQGPPQSWSINGIDPPEGGRDDADSVGDGEVAERNRMKLEESVRGFD